MERSKQSARDRAILVVRLATFGGATSALGITWLFSNLAEAYFSGKPASAHPSPPPQVPVAAAPKQQPPPVVQTVVHHPRALRRALLLPRRHPRHHRSVTPRPPSRAELRLLCRHGHPQHGGGR